MIADEILTHSVSFNIYLSDPSNKGITNLVFESRVRSREKRNIKTSNYSRNNSDNTESETVSYVFSPFTQT